MWILSETQIQRTQQQAGNRLRSRQGTVSAAATALRRTALAVAATSMMILIALRAEKA